MYSFSKAVQDESKLSNNAKDTSDIQGTEVHNILDWHTKQITKVNAETAHTTDTINVVAVQPSLSAKPRNHESKDRHVPQYFD